MKRLVLILLLLCAAAASATHTCSTCYIDFVNGADSNDGTTETTGGGHGPWKHAPFMTGATGNAATQAPVAGDVYILKGGVIWDYTIWPWEWTSNGGSSSTSTVGCVGTGCVTITTDQTWYDSTACSGKGYSGFCRPVLDGGGWSNSPTDTTCYYDAATVSGNQYGEFGYHSYWIINDLEWTGMCSSTGLSNASGAKSSFIQLSNGSGADHYTISNNYFHGILYPGSFAPNPTSTGSPAGDYASFIFGPTGGCSGDGVYAEVHDNVFDNSDGTNANLGQGYYGGEAVYGGPGHFYRNVVYDLPQTFDPGCLQTFHDNLVMNGAAFSIGATNSGSGTHAHVMNATGNATQSYIYNDVYVTVRAGQGVNPNMSSQSVFIFNELMLDNLMATTGNPTGATAGNTANGYNISGTGTAYIFDNGMEGGPDAATPSGQVARTGTATVDLAGNFIITTLTSGFVSTAGGTVNVGTNLQETLSTANGHGYLCGPIVNGRCTGQTFAFSPTSASSPTVGAGANQTSGYCALISDATAAAACLKDTTYAVAYDSVNHLVVAGSPRTPLARPSTGAWDAGAYQFPPIAQGVNGPGAGYAASTSTAIVQPPATPNMGGPVKSGLIFFDTSYGSGTPAPVIRCTDQNTAPNNPNQNKQAGIGGSGDAVQLFAADDHLLGIESGGGYYIVPFSTTTSVCSPAITADKNLSNPGSSSVAYNFGSGSFDWSNPLLYYAMSDGNDATATQVAQYTFNSSNQFTVTNPIVDFTYGLPYGTQAPAWTGSSSYTSGDYISFTFSEPDWIASNAYSTLGTLIIPLLNNFYNCAFKLVVAGTSSGTEPTWSTSAQGRCVPASNGTLTDGTARWRNIGAGATFTYQLTSSSGSSGSGTPAFSPNFNTTTTDSSLTWTNVGVAIAQPPWSDPSGISEDSTRFGFGFSTNDYGNSGNYNAYNGDQGTGVYAAAYSSTLNQFFLLNTLTGFVSATTCAGGSGYNCSGGTLSKLTALGSIPAITSCPFVIHNVKSSTELDFVAVIEQGAVLSGSGCAGHGVSWQPFAVFNSSTTAQEFPYGLNHWAMMHHTLFAQGGQQSGLNGGFTGGTYSFLYALSNPSATPPISWQVGYAGGSWAGTPQTTNCDVHGTWTPNDTNPPCDFADAYDGHPGSGYNPGDTDTAPVCGTMYNVATLAPPPVAPYQGEEICVSTYPTWSYGSPIPAYRVWRFTHNQNSGGSSDFSTQFGISQMSHTGNYLAFSSDWNCTLGNTAGGTSPINCGPPWNPNTVYANGKLINPFANFNGSGTNFGVYEVTTGGTSASTAPAWFVCNSGTAGNTITDTNGVIYTCQGASNGKGEVFIVQLAGLGHPYLWLDSTELTFLAAKVNAPSSDWTALKAIADGYAGVGGTAYSVQFPTGDGQTTSTTRGYPAGCNAGGGPFPLQNGYQGGNWDGSYTQNASYVEILGAAYQGAIIAGDATRQAAYLAEAHCIVQAIAQPFWIITDTTQGITRYGASICLVAATGCTQTGFDLQAGANFQLYIPGTKIAAGDSVTISLPSGVTTEGCSEMLGTFTVSTVTSVGITFPGTLTNNCTLYSISPTADAAYSSRFFVPAISKLYDWFYSGLAAGDITLLQNAALAWMTDMIDPTFKTVPENNFTVGYVWASVAAYVAFCQDSAGVCTAAQNLYNKEFLGVGLTPGGGYKPYHQEWLSGGGDGEGWQAYGYDSIHRINEAQFAMWVYGNAGFACPTGVGSATSTAACDWRSGLSPWTFLDDGLVYDMQFVTPTLLSEDDANEYTFELGQIYCTTPCTSTWWPTEASYFPLWLKTFDTMEAARLSSSKANQYKSFYDAVYSAENAAAGPPSGLVPTWANLSAPYQTSPEPILSFLWLCPSGQSFQSGSCATNSTTWYTGLPLLYCGWSGDYCATRQDWNDATAVYVNFFGGVDRGAGGNGKTQYISGTLTIQQGNERLLVNGLAEASRRPDLITETGQTFLQDERNSAGNQKGSVWWASYSGAQTNNIGIPLKTPPPGQIPSYSPPWPSSTTQNSILYAEDQPNYSYLFAQNLQANGVKSNLSPFDYCMTKWNRGVFYLRSGIVAVHDSTVMNSACAGPQFLNWVFPATPAAVTTRNAIAVPSTMVSYDVTDSTSVYRGAAWMVLPSTPSVTLVNHSNTHISGGAPLNYLYEAQVNLPADTSDSLAVFQPATAVSSIFNLQNPSCTNADCVTINDGSDSVVAFATLDPKTSGTITIPYPTGTLQVYIPGLTPNASYGASVTSHVLTITGSGTAVAASAAGVLNYNSTPITQTGISVSPTSATLTLGGTVQITATCSYTNGSSTSTADCTATAGWSSSNSAVASVSSSGLVTAIAASSSTVTITASLGGFSANSIITISSPVVVFGGVNNSGLTAH